MPFRAAACRAYSGLHAADTAISLARRRPQRRIHAFQPPTGRGPRFLPPSLVRFSSGSARIMYRVAVSSSGKGRRFHPLKNVYEFDPNVLDALGLEAAGAEGSRIQSAKQRRRHRSDSGEDAFFVSKVGAGAAKGQDEGAIAFGVADGVGGWTESRVDPGDFSRGLCSYMAKAALGWTSGAEKLRAKSLLQMGYDRVVEDDSILAGGSTASVGVGLTDGRVDLANLGDSGSVLLRLAAVHHYSTPQTHGFNTPYQLSIIPPRMRAQASIFGGGFLEDLPRDAVVTSLRMQHGDVLVLATDGVFDNLNNQDILKIVSSRMLLAGAWTATPDMGISVSDDLDHLTRPGGLSHLRLQFHPLQTSARSRPSSSSSSPPSTSSPSPSSPQPESASASVSLSLSPRSTYRPPPPSQNNPFDADPPGSDTADESPASSSSSLPLQSVLAVFLAGEAKLASIDLRRDSPFAKEAQRHYPGDWYRGGKVDDICVVVVLAVEEGRCCGIDPPPGDDNK